MNKNRQDAIMDCQYALSLSESALQNHLDSWLGMDDACKECLDNGALIYLLTLQEIQAKLHTNECLLKEGNRDAESRRNHKIFRERD